MPILIASLMLTACESLTKRAALELPPLPAELTQRCPDLAPVPDGKLSTLARTLVNDARLYRLCQARHAALVEAAVFARRLQEIDDDDE